MYDPHNARTSILARSPPPTEAGPRGPCASRRSARKARSPRCLPRSARCRRRAQDQGARSISPRTAVTQALTRVAISQSSALDARMLRDIDVTLPVREPPAEQGRIHPLSQTRTSYDDLRRQGFRSPKARRLRPTTTIAQAELSRGHPAREMHDTVFFNPKPDGSRMLLRTPPRRCRCAPC